MPARSRYGMVNPRHPEAAARCDRGGEIVKRSELTQEMFWAGNRLMPSGFLCCARHIDPAHPQDRIPPVCVDPVPVDNPRPNIDNPS